MHGTSDPVRPLAPPNQAQAMPISEVPRRRLVVEVWDANAPVREPVPAPVHGRSIRRREVSRGLTGVAVVILHASLGAWLWTAGAGLSPAPRVESLILLAPVVTAAAARPSAVAELPAPDLLPVPLHPDFPTLPRAYGSSEIALSISSPTDVVISDANAGDVALVLGGCRADKTHRALFVDRPAEITLLVRVESDGRVTDSRVEAGSGRQSLDEAAQRCLRTHGSFEPRRINGAPVASWLRVHWPAA
jgi:TonB family protein